MTSRAHANVVQQEFTSQASIWSGSVPTHLQELASTLNLSASDTVLDVAAGSCRVSRAIAPWVKHVTALELTEAMLNQGKEMAHKEGLNNITFMLGAAEQLKEQIRTAVQLELAGGPLTGLQSFLEDGQVKFKVGVVRLVGQKRFVDL
jgi:tRNA/tmRNA/rRNA uracil-C5-methylase (TrmA/RlmC/RlmD family)